MNLAKRSSNMLRALAVKIVASKEERVQEIEPD